MAAYLSIVLLTLSLSLHLTPILGAWPRLGALDDAAIPSDTAGFAPRFHMDSMDSIPAVPAEPFSPNPAFILNGRELDQRAGDNCQPGYHGCAEINITDCCPNERYCFLDENWAPKCCRLGYKCPDAVCEPDQLYCNVTLTNALASPTPTSTGIRQQNKLVTSLVSYVTSASCCNRPCGESSYLCEAYYGGQCCPNGYHCGLSFSCVQDPVTSSSLPPVIPKPSACTDSQFPCSDGRGCCNIGSICTYMSGYAATSTPACVPEPALSSRGLSSGAKAGIGIAAALGGSIVIVAVAWICVRRRRSLRSTGEPLPTSEMQHNAGANKMVGGGRIGRARAAQNSITGAMTVLSDATTNFTSRTPSNDHGRSHSYLGPNAVAGPFTEGSASTGLGITVASPTGMPPSESGAGRPGGVPYNPDHIMRPVELGGKEAQKGIIEEANCNTKYKMPNPDESPTVNVYELMGSPGSSSLKPEGGNQQTLGQSESEQGGHGN
ncbi:hypothetical protein GGS21DRAFT_410290 [Xylaria nigripes]|nr:hypothetical protein GGS21DRAFT_410290 [Xylaria nigripes]